MNASNGTFGDRSHLSVTRDAIVHGRRFWLHLEYVDEITVAVDLQIKERDGRSSGQMQGQVLASELVAGAHALVDLFKGAAATLGKEKGSVPPFIERARRRHPNAYKPWTADDDEKLLADFRANLSIPELSRKFGRRPSAIKTRLDKILPPSEGRQAHSDHEGNDDEDPWIEEGSSSSRP